MKDHLAYCWAMAETGQYASLATRYTQELLPLLKMINDDFSALETEFNTLKQEITHANTDAGVFLELIQDHSERNP